ncbi:transcriptional repressor [Patescibacteria group bacterium]|nr:transcriptional repressor [Patescibacteria group bacterium]MBU1682947.1 transcriptional repressor [Patescibacteria group bacterium]MBU1934923.1 transcriptional repressor [Patescibacteria group bacterium]
MITKDKNQRVTRQRKIILDEICKVCCHPTAKQVYKMTKKKMPNIGLATVYRTLDFLEKKNLIIKLQSKNSVTKYDGNTSRHCHLICKLCGKIIDIFDIKKVKIDSDELKKSGFEPSLDFLEIHGICKKCKNC